MKSLRLFLFVIALAATLALAQNPHATLHRHLLSGFAETSLSLASQSSQNLSPLTLAPLAPTFSLVNPVSYPNYSPANTGGCITSFGSNVRVNSNCLNLSDPDLQGRAQANDSPQIAVDPNNPSHLLAAFNDYRDGDERCFASFSRDAGKTWSDSSLPISFTRGTFVGFSREYWEASGDPSVAWDTRGNAYIACMTFQRGGPSSPNHDLSSALYVFRSTQNGGASWNFPARPVVQVNDTTGGGASIVDTPFMTTDNRSTSVFRDRVYVVWTLFSSDGTAYIYEAYSNDYGETFSTPVVVSSDSTLCPNTYGIPTPSGRCNENEFPHAVAGPDGTLYVVWNNFNNGVVSPDNRYQVLSARSTDGGVTFSPPVRVSTYYDLPDCFTYQGQDPGRSCVPEKGSATNSFFRALNYPVPAVSPSNSLVVTFGSYINLYSNESNGCIPGGFSGSGNPLYTGVKTAGACSNKILLSISNDGGATFTGGTTDPRSLPTVNSTPAQANTDQWFQWAGFGTNTPNLVVSYYDRQYGSDETTGNMDITLSVASAALVRVLSQRVTTTSMPVPTEFSGTFMGDYSGLAVAGLNALPIWTDNRPVDLFLCPGTAAPGTPPQLCTQTNGGIVANDQDVYTTPLNYGWMITYP